MSSTFPSVSDVCRACADGDLTLLKILISRRAPVDSLCQPVYVRDRKHLISGWPPVRVAARYAQYRVLQLLLSLDAVEPNRPSLDDGRIALHDAVELGNLLIVDMLLKAGSDPLIRDDRGHNSLDIARAERNTTVLEILLESVSVPPSGAVYYHMPSTLSDRVGTGSERALKDSEPTSGAVHYHLPSTLSDRTGLDGGDVRSRDSSAFRRVISLESDEYGKRSQLRNSWISNEYEHCDFKPTSLDDIVFETNLRESPFFSGLISQLTELQLQNELLSQNQREDNTSQNMPNDTTTDPSVSNKFDPDFVRTNFPPASERAAKDERSDLIREIAGTRNAVVNSFISDGPVARKPFTASTAGKGVRTRDYIGNRMNQSNDEVTQMKKQIATLEENMQALLERLGMSGGSKKAREEQDEIVVMDEYPKPVLLKNSKYLARYPVPKEKKSWQLEYPGYAPILYSAQELFTKPRDTMQQKFNLMEKVKADGGYEKNMLYYPPIWADPELLGMTMNDRDMYFKFNDRAKVPYHPMHGPDKTTEVNRISYLGTYQLDPITGAPLNPSGRTGMVGRGLLGKYGPNHAADPVVTCFSTKSGPKTLKLALISRQDTKEFALPGGMVDPGENELSGTAIREFCEEAIEGDETGALSPQEKKKRRAEIVKRFVQHKQMEEPIISKVVDDPRNTDNAWMETQAFWFHFATEDDLGRKLQAGDDAVGAQWVDLDADFDINCLYADHSEIVIQLFREIGKADSKEFSDLVIPNSVQAKL